MLSVEFAAQRRERLTRADDDLHGVVSAGLLQYANGEAGWKEEILDTAAQLWLEYFEAEAPGRAFERPLARFRNRLDESLDKTAVPVDGEVTESQADRVTKWVSSYTVNSGTTVGAFGRGITHKRWITMHDASVRDIHQDLDGQIVPIGGTFDVAGSRLGFPGEPVGPPEVWINCRCLAQPASRTGEPMSLTTHTIGPDDQVELDNPNIVTGDDIYAGGDPFPNEEEGDGIHVDEEAAPAGAVVQWTDESGTRFYGPFDTPENAAAWIESEGSPFDGEGVVIGADEVPADAVVQSPADEDDEELAVEEMPPDELEEGEELITEIPIHGVATVEDTWTGDRRFFEVDAVSWRELPLPFRYQPTDIGGHDGAVTVGRLDAIYREGNEIRYDGAIVLNRPYAQEVIEGLLSGTIKGVSVDVDDIIVNGRATQAALEEQEAEFDSSGMLQREPTVYAAVRIAGLTGVAIPAFQEGWAALGHWAEAEQVQEALAACGCLKAGIDLEEPEVVEAITASATFAPGTKDGPGWITNPVATSRIRRYWVSGKGAAKIRWGAPGDFNRCRSQLAKYVQNPDWLAGLCANMHFEALGFWPAQHRGKAALETAEPTRDGLALVASGERKVWPAEFFTEPEDIGRAYPVRIDRETRHIYGYLAAWGECHIGIDGACVTPPESDNDYAYFLKGRVLTTEGEQRVGNLTYGIGHANERARAAAATAHYDKVEAVRAFVNMGENGYGIWYAGILPRWVTDDMIDDVLAIGAFSGDWRDWGNDKVDLVGAVAVNTPGFQLAASGGRQISLIAAGALKPEVLVASAGIGIDAETAAAIARTAVAEYRHQEKVAAKVGPIREKIRVERLARARARHERSS